MMQNIGGYYLLNSTVLPSLYILESAYKVLDENYPIIINTILVKSVICTHAYLLSFTVLTLLLQYLGCHWCI